MNYDQFFLMFPRKGTGLEHPDALLRNWRGEFAAQYTDLSKAALSAGSRENSI